MMNNVLSTFASDADVYVDDYGGNRCFARTVCHEFPTMKDHEAMVVHQSTKLGANTYAQHHVQCVAAV